MQNTLLREEQLGKIFDLQGSGQVDSLGFLQSTAIKKVTGTLEVVITILTQLSKYFTRKKWYFRTHHMDYINGDITSLNTLYGNKQHISSSLSRALVVNYFLPI